MTQRTLVALATLGLGLSLGCRPKSGAGSSSPPTVPPLLAHYHFAGGAQLSTNLNAAKLKSIWNLPATGRLADQTLERLAHAPEAWWGPAAQPFHPATTALIRPFLDDLLETESYGEWRGQTNHLAEWTLAVRLNAARAQLWETNWWRFAVACHLGAPVRTNLGTLPAWEVNDTRQTERFRMVRVGDWTVLGAGSDGLTGQAALLDRMQTRHAPGAALGDTWLEAGGETACLQNWSPVRPGSRWPAAELSVWGQDKDLRTRLTLRYPDPIKPPEGPWQVPTNLIRAPLVSFTAMRGIAPCLAQLPWVRSLRLPSLPDQLFVWAQQSRIPAQTFAAVPLPDATNAVDALALWARDSLAPELVRHQMGEIQWFTNRTELGWVSLPFLGPSLRAVREPAGTFLAGGLFPPLPSTNSPPPELIAQVAGRTNLVYYDWELTGERLIHWRALSQLYSILAAAWRQRDVNQPGHPPAGPTPDPLPEPNAPTQKWLEAIAPLLGNTITRANQTSNRQILVERKSPLGLTGFEIIMLTRLLEDPRFLSFGRPVLTSAVTQAPPASVRQSPAVRQPPPVH